jgi:hypothetical protein
MFFPVIFSTLPAHGQTNALPPLSPPYGELPPTFWGQHGMTAVIVGLAMIVLAAFGFWLIFRPRPKIMVPPAVQARHTLEVLRGQTENGALLVRVSQILRNYFIAAFQLTSGELTTAEFARALAGCPQIENRLADDVTGFLRDCDERKFSPTQVSAPLDAVNRALQLVAATEERRAQLRQPAETQKQSRRA